MMIAASSCGDGGTGTKGIPSLVETYRKDDPKPFGASVAHQMLQQLYPGTSLRSTSETMEQTWINVYDTGSVYFSLSKSLYTSEADVTSIMEFVKAGNHVVLSSEYFDNNLMEHLGFRLGYNYEEILNYVNKGMRSTGVRLNESIVSPADPFNYYYKPFAQYFSTIPASNARVLGYNDNGKPNSFVYFYGNGRLILHCAPRSFSNYFLLQKNNYQYLQGIFSATRKSPQHVYWNDFYVKQRRSRSGSDNSGGGGNGSRSSSSSSSKDDNKSKSSLSEVMNNPGLRAAFWLILILLLLFILYGMKRRQRIIEKVQPNENTTVTFTETIGRLYLQNKDNRNIAEKMVTYFNESVRNQYFLNTSKVDEDFITTLGRKSGISRDRIEALYKTIGEVQQQVKVSDTQILTLNQQIQNFYKNKI